MASAGGIRAGKAFVELGVDDKTQAALQKAQLRLKAYGASVKSIGQGLITLSAAVVGAVAVSTRIFSGFDDRMRVVQAVTQATEKDFASLTEEAKRLGRTTSFTASQVANAMVELGRAGFDPKQILTMTEAMLALAKATDTELARATEIAGATMRAFNLEADQTGRVTDVLTATANKSAQTLDDLAEALKPVAPIAEAAGEDLESTAAAIGILANNGIKGSLAGNALARAYKNLSTEAKQVELRKLGVEAVDAAGNLRPLAGILNDLAKQAQGLGSAQRLSLFETLFGRGQAAALKLSSSGKAFETLAQEIRESTGIAIESAGKMEEGLGGVGRRMLSAAEGVGLAIGKAFEDSLGAAGTSIAEIAGKVTAWVTENQAAVVSVGKVAFAAGALGVTLMALGLTATATASALGGLIAVLKAAQVAMAATAVASKAVYAALMGLSVTKVVGMLRGLVAALFAVDGALLKVVVSAQAAWASIAAAALPIAAVAAVIVAFVALGVYVTKASTKVEDLHDRLKRFREEGDKQRRLDEARIERLQALARAGRLSDEQMSEAADLLIQLERMHGKIGIAVNEHTREVRFLAGAYEKLQQEMLATALAELDREINGAKEKIRELADEMFSLLEARGPESIRIIEVNTAMVERVKLEEKVLELSKRRIALLGGEVGAITGEAKEDEGDTQRERTRSEQDAATGDAKFTADWARRVHQLRLQLIADEHQRQIALVNERYDYEVTKAQEAGRSGQDIQAINEARSLELHKLDSDLARQNAAARKQLEQERQALVIANIKDDYERELASIRLRYAFEIKEAIRLGDVKRVQLLQQMEGLERERALANELLRNKQKADRITSADTSQGETVEELRLKFALKGYELEKSLLALQRKRAIDAAREAGENVALVQEEFDLRRAMLDQDRRETKLGAQGGFSVAGLVGQFAKVPAAVTRAQRRLGGAAVAARSGQQVTQAAKYVSRETLLEGINKTNAAIAADVERIKLAMTNLANRIGTA